MCPIKPTNVFLLPRSHHLTGSTDNFMFCTEQTVFQMHQPSSLPASYCDIHNITLVTLIPSRERWQNNLGPCPVPRTHHCFRVQTREDRTSTIVSNCKKGVRRRSITPSAKTMQLRYTHKDKPFLLLGFSLALAFVG